MKGLINIQNEDNECFRWCLVRYLNPVNKNPVKILNVDKEFAKQLNFKGVKFPVHKNGKHGKIEKQIFPLIYLITKMEHHTIFIIQNKLLKNTMIYYYY